MRYLKLLPILLILLDACVDPLQFELTSASSRMVVDGMITNEPGPYKVSIVYSGNLENSLRLPIPVSGASVSIVSSLNETEQLIETSAGVYESSVDGMQGQIGVSYYLKIVKGSDEYRSSPQTLTPAGNIDDLYIEFAQNEIVSADGTENTDAFKLFIDSHGIEGGENHYRWRWTGVNKVRTWPELYTLYEGTLPAPWPCSGYIYNGDLIKISECECCICWMYNYSSTATVSNNSFLKGDEYKKVEVGSVPITGINFYERYHVEVEQLSVSEEVHEFWKMVESQQKALGSLFQPNAVKIKGNIKSLTNPSEEVLGIFSASAITRKSMFIDQEQVPYPIPPIVVLAYDCRTSFKNATTEKPWFW